MANTTPDEEIIEKRPSNPVATACLVVAALATLTAVVFQIWEIHYVRADMASERASPAPHEALYKKNISEFKAAVKKVVDDHDHPEITLEVSGKAAGTPPGGEAAVPVAEPPAGAATEEPAPEGKAADTPPTDTPAPDTETKDSEKAAETGNTEPPPADAEPAGKDAEQKDSSATEKEADQGAAEPPAKEEPAKEEPASGEGQN